MSPEWIMVDSSAVDAVAFEDGELYVEYKGGARYAYFLVPEHVFEALLEADLIGTFINKEIKPIYDCREL